VSLEVSLREGESQESLLHRFQRMVQMSGVLREIKANRHYIPKSEAARIRVKKNAQRKRRQGY
jgi:ribosomal protein S21